MASGHQSISELLRKYQIEIFGVAAAFVAILVFRVLFRKPEPKTKQENTNNTNTTSSSTSSSSSKQEASSTGNMESVNISLGELKEGEMKQIDVGETGSFVVVKDKSDVFAFSSKCSHLAAPMKTGYYSNGRVRCPWHGACFSAKTGDIEDFPCVDGIHAFKTSVKGDQVTVNVPTEALKNPKRQIPINAKVTTQETIVILGAGPAGHTAAEELRHQGFEGRIVMIGKEKHLPYDRTKLSKQMEATADKIALRPASFFESAKIELKLGTTVTAVNPSKHTVTLSDNSELTYSKLLIATGGEARTLPVPGKELSNIYPLRVPEDSQAILKNVDGKRVVIVGTSFIGMEAASCLYKKAKSIIAIGMEEVPFERVLGKQIGSGLQKLFESNNIQFRLKRVVKEFKGTNGSVSSVILDDGEELQADLCILGAGIIPSTKILSGLSEIKLEKDGSVICDEYLKASQDIWAAGDIARFPYSGLNGHLMRVEHYAYSQFQGRVAARNMMGQKEACKSVPFFWTNIFGKRFTYAGHAHVYDEVVVDGKIDDFKFAAYFLHKEKVCAVVAVGRDPIASKAAEMFHNGTMLSAADVKGGKFL